MASTAQERLQDRCYERRGLTAEDELRKDTVVVVMTEAGLAESEHLFNMFDHLNYFSYRSHRERLTESQAKRMFVRLEIGSQEDVDRWEKRYVQGATI